MKFASRSIRAAATLAILGTFALPGMAIGQAPSGHGGHRASARPHSGLCSEVCSGGPANLGSVGASASTPPSPCSEVCSGGGYGLIGSKTPVPTTGGGPGAAVVAIATGLVGLALVAWALVVPRRRARRSAAIAP